MKSTLLGTLFLIVILVSCKPQTTTTQSSSSSPNFNSSSCTIGKWPDSSLPLNLKISAEFAGDFTGADFTGGLNTFEQMAKNWNTPVQASKVLITTPFQTADLSGYNATSSFRDSELGIYKSFNWFSNVSSSALAITQFFGYIDSSPGLGQFISLTHADIIVNYRHFGSDIVMRSPSIDEYDLPTIIQHELGHFLGLCHETNSSSVMAPYYITTQRSLQTFDRNRIEDLYVDGVIAGLQAQSNANAITAPKGTEVKGIIELRSDGECRHYINGELDYIHKVDLKKKL